MQFIGQSLPAHHFFYGTVRIFTLSHIVSQAVFYKNSFKLAKKRSRRYPNTNYADDLAILANTLAQAETLLHSLEQAAAGIGLHVNAHKTEYMCFNQAGHTRR